MEEGYRFWGWDCILGIIINDKKKRKARKERLGKKNRTDSRNIWSAFWKCQWLIAFSFPSDLKRTCECVWQNERRETEIQKRVLSKEKISCHASLTFLYHHHPWLQTFEKRREGSTILKRKVWEGDRSWKSSQEMIPRDEDCVHHQSSCHPFIFPDLHLLHHHPCLAVSPVISLLSLSSSSPLAPLKSWHERWKGRRMNRTSGQRWLSLMIPLKEETQRHLQEKKDRTKKEDGDDDSGRDERRIFQKNILFFIPILVLRDEKWEEVGKEERQESWMTTGDKKRDFHSFSMSPFFSQRKAGNREMETKRKKTKHRMK